MKRWLDARPREYGKACDDEAMTRKRHRFGSSPRSQSPEADQHLSRLCRHVSDLFRPHDGRTSTAADKRDDARRHVACRLVLPVPRDNPARAAKRRVHFFVALDVARELRPPIVGVPLRVRRMHRTPMPKTTVNEYGDPLGGEHYVGSSPSAQRREIDSIAEPGGVQ
jgi:hypothetical protein